MCSLDKLKCIIYYIVYIKSLQRLVYDWWVIILWTGVSYPYVISIMTSIKIYELNYYKSQHHFVMSIM